MNCPVCKTVELMPGYVGDPVPNLACDACQGRWFSLDDYEMWLLRQPLMTYNEVQRRPLPVPVESKRFHYCPEDGTPMSKFKVVDEGDIYVDRCACCGGLWLDRYEWEILRKRDMTREIHNLFLLPWHHESVLRFNESTLRSEKELLRGLLCDEELLDVERILNWLGDHPFRDQVLELLHRENDSSQPSQKSGLDA